MVKLHEHISLFVIFIALIPLSSCDYVVTVTEDEAVQLEFPYPCDIKNVTIQIANRRPFYNSAEPESLNLPSYQLNRFNVTSDKNCLVQVKINPVKRNDEATYIRQAYKDSVIQSELTRIRLNVNYPPGDASCTFSINGGIVTDWVPLQCEAPVGSLTGGIYCYQGSKILPSQSKLVKIDESLKQTIWARKEYPVFCCSSTLDQPKDMCECKDFVWDPSDTEEILNPCPVTTAGQGTISEGPAETSGDHLFTDTVNPPTSKTGTNNVTTTSLLWVGGITILILVTALVIVILYLCHIEETNTNSLTVMKEGHPETQIFITKMQECGSQTSPNVLPILLTNGKVISRSSSWGYLRFIDFEGIFPRKGSLKAKSMGILGEETFLNSLTDGASNDGI